MIYLDTTQVEGNLFNFKSQGGLFKGNFRAKINTVEEFKTLLKLIQ